MILKLLWGSKLARMVTVVFAGFIAWQANNAIQRHKGGQAVIKKSAEVGKVNNAKATKSHAAAQRPGAAQRLLKSDCRDCR